MSNLIRAQDVEAEEPEFLWENRIPKGMISVIAGRPDQGKGLLAVHITAEVSRNGGKVLHSAAEDSHGLMTRPRLEAAGAKLENVLLPSTSLSLPDNLGELVELIMSQKLELVILDPFASHLSGKINRHGDAARAVLEPLKAVIQATGTAVLIVEHALKRVPQSGHPLQAIGGTALPQFARAAFVYGKDPDDEDNRILAPAKFNIGVWPKALAFEIDTTEIETSNGKRAEFPFLMQDEELAAFDPMRLFQSKNQPGRSVGRPADKRAAACEWLTNYLAGAGRPVHAGKVQEDAKQYGMAGKTLRRAAEDMGIVKAPPGGGRNTTWDLPPDVKQLMGIPEPPPDGSDAAPVEPIGPKLPDGSFYLIEMSDREDLDEGSIGELDVKGFDQELSKLLGGGDQA